MSAPDRAAPPGQRISVSYEGPPAVLLAMADDALGAGRSRDAADLLLGAAARAADDPRLRHRVAARMNNLASRLFGEGTRDLACALLERAVALRPERALYHANLGRLQMGLDRFDEALESLKRACALEPPRVDWLLWLAMLAENQRRPVDAARHYDDALALDPDNEAALAGRIYARLSLADWTTFESDSARFAELVRRADRRDTPSEARPFLTLLCPIDDVDRRIVAERWSRRQPAFVPFVDGAARRAAGRPLRIGYLSADFRRHPTAHLMMSLFKAHDRGRVRVHVYSLGPDDGSEQRAAIAADADRFVDLKDIDDSTAAGRIRDDEVDILVDLMVHTRLAREGILARRPAPLQVAYLGYPGTSGAPWIDYVVADDVVLPPGRRDGFSERVIALPRCYQVNNPAQRLDDAPVRRADWDLPEDAVVFCAFNAAIKIEPRGFALWMEILRRVPGSVLWLLDGGAEATFALRRRAAIAGIDPARLVFARKIARPPHLARHRCADLFLDTMIYGAHTSASDALFAGLPVVTTPGPWFAARVAASLLTTLGLADLIAPDTDTYRDFAVALATDPAHRAATGERVGRAVRESPLYDVAGFARDLETGLELAWARHAKGEAPADISISARQD